MKMIFKNIVDYLFVKPSLGRIKISLFPVLVLGLTSDYLIEYNFSKKEISIEAGSDEIILSILLLFIFIVIIFVDFYERHRESIRDEKILKIINEGDVSDNIKAQIAESLSN